MSKIKNTASMKKAIFISDLHLEENRPDITRCFMQFLQSCDASISALYILGDLFEVWIGDDEATSYQNEIMAALAAATSKGLFIYFLPGNRDFLIGNDFLQKTGCQLLQDETVVLVNDKPVLLMHGDTLCTRDIDYIKARVWLRNKTLQKIFLCLPLFIRKKIANKMRNKSIQHTQTTALDIMDVTHEEVTRVMQKHAVATLIHGHTHRPGIHEFTINNKSATRIVLGAWHDVGNKLVWDDNGYELVMKIEVENV